MGVKERYEEKQKATKSSTTGVAARYEHKKKGEEIDKYFEDVQSYFKWTAADYNSYSYDNAAAGRSKIDYYTNDLRTRGNEIRAWLDANKDTLDAKSYADIIASLDSIGSGLDSIYGEYDKKLNYISGFNSAEEYNKLPYNPQVQKTAQEYLQNGLRDGSFYKNQQGAEGWNKYLADNKANMEAAKAAQKKKSFWEKAGDVILEAAQMSAQSGDSNIPMQGMLNAQIDAYRNDVSYMRPQDDWSKVQQYEFGRLYLESPEKAYAYAEETNKKNAQAKEEAARKEIQDNATSGFWAGAGNTIGAIATAPLGMADFLDDIAKISAGREVTPDGNISPFEYSQAVTEGISTHLNEKGGVLNENIPVIGGKGWGDVYGLGTSIAQSMASAYTLGPYGTLVSYFGQGAAAGVDDALRRGASEDQALLYGTLLGTFEGVAEMIGIEHLFKLGSASTIKGVIKNILKQAGAEGTEEGLTTVLNNIADAWVMQDKSNFNKAIEDYMAQGMSKSQAQWKVFWDSIEGILYDAAGGAVSGGVSGGIHTGINAIGNNAAIKEHGQAILDNGGQDALMRLARETVDADKKLTRLTDKAEAKPTASRIGKLSAYMEQSNAKANRDTFQRAFEQQGLSKKDAERATAYVMDELSPEESAKLEKNKTVMDAVDAVIENPNLNIGADTIKLALARENVKTDLQNETNGDIIDTESEEISNEGNEGTESVRLRDSSERLGGTNTERQISRVESGTGSLAQRRQTVEGKPRDRQASRLVDEGREVSVASLGVSKGSKIHTVRLLDIAPENEIDSMKAARKEAEKRGLIIKFFAGGNLVIEENTEANVGKADKDKTYFEANGYINGKVMLVRVDHYKFTADQIARHEIGHDMISKGEVDINAVREKLVEIVGDKERIDEIASLYAQAYAKTGLNENEIWEECICDSLGDMNIFGYDKEAAELMRQAIPDIQKAVKETAKAPNQTRGSPEGKASYAGRLAETANLSALDRAEQMIAEGVDSETIRKETGWFQGYDGEWRFEIDDSQAEWNLDSAKPDPKRLFEFGERIFKLTDLLDHPDLYKAYPQIKKVTVWENPYASTGGYVVGKNTETFTVKSLADTNINKDILIHEIQHLIQNIEGFSTGASVDQFEYKAWGEKEYAAYEKRNEIASKLYAILRRHGVSITKSDIASVRTDLEVRDGIIDYNWMRINSLADSNPRTAALLDEYNEQVQILNLTTPSGQYHAVAGEIEAYDVQARRRQSAEERKNIRPNIDRKDVIFADGSGKSYVIKKDGKGREYWEIDSGKDIFKGLTTPDEYRDAAFEFLIANRDNKVSVKDDSGKEIIFIRLSAEEFTQSVESQTLFDTNPTMFAQKMRLIPSLDDILLHSNVNWRSPDHKNHKLFKKNGFENYRGRVRIDNVIFNTIVRVGKAKFGDVFYDINLEVDSYLPHASNGASDINKSTSITDSIPQKTDLSTPSEKISSGKASRETNDIDADYNRLFEMRTEETKLRQTIKDFESSDDFKAQHDKLSDAVANDNIEKGFAAYEKWKKESGYGKLLDRKDKLKKDIDQLQKQLENERVDNELAKERAAIEKSGLSEADYFRSQAVEVFGYTPYFYDAGYILPNGKMLNFSGEKGKHFGSRGDDHRAIGQVYANTQGSDALVRFMSDGNIRIMAESPGIDLTTAVEPTVSQYNTISRFIANSKSKRYFFVDFTDESGNYAGSNEYEGNISTEEVIYDIKQYYKTGEARGRKEDFSRELDVITYMDEEAIREGREMDESKAPTDRERLANALESITENEIEKNKLAEYKAKIEKMNAETEKLAQLKSEIKELTFGKGEKNPEKLKNLRSEATKTENRINTYDKQLLNLEATTALKNVLQREKQKAYKRAAEKGREAMRRNVEGRNKTAMRHKIKDVVNELNRYLTKGTKDKHVPIELQKSVAEALDAVNMDTVGAEERIAKKQAEMRVAKSVEEMQRLSKEIEHIQEMGGNMEAKLSRLKTAYDSIINSDDPLIANSHDDVISNTIDKVIEVVGDTPLRDMSLYQLEAVYDMYKMVLTSVRNANKAFKAAKGEEISTIANGVIAELNEKKRKSPYSVKAVDKLSEFDWNNLKPVYAFERIGSANFTKVFKEVREGEDVWANDMSEAQAFREEQFKKYKYDSWDFKKRYGFTSTSGKQFELSLGQILSLYAFSKRDQAGDHLKYGGFVFDGLTEVKEKTKAGVTVTYQLKDATAYNLSEETLAEIIDKLTPEQRAFADAMQDYLSTVMGEKGNEVSLALYDIKLFKEKNYFPLKSAPQYMAKAKEQAQGEVKIKNSGFTKETTPKAKNPIVLSSFMDVWAGHVNEMSMYHAFTLPLEDFYRVYSYHTSADEKMGEMSVGASLENAYGQASVRYIDQLLKDINGGARVDSTVGAINKLIGLFKKSAVFASASVVIQQPSAIARATALVDTKYFVGKPAKGKHKEIWAEVKKYAPVAIIKEMGYFDTGMGKSSVEWLKGEKTWKDKVDDFASKAPALADEYTWCAIWDAVKRETLHTHKDLRPNSEEFLKAVGERFTEVVTKTQVYDSVLSRSGNMRSKDTGMKMATAFMAEPTTSLNMLENALIQGKRGNKIYARKAIGSVVASMILNSILVSIIYAGRDDDEEKTYAEKYVGTLTEELLDSLNPLTLIPFVKDIVSIAQGYDVERSDMAVITDLINAWNNLDSDNRSAYRKVEDFAGAIASIFGLPLKNVMRDARGMYNTVDSFINGEKTTGEGIKNAVTEAVTGKEISNGQQLYEAILKGDTKQIERVKGRFEDQNAINSAIRKALKENDPRVEAAAQALLDGNYKEYSDLIEDVVAEGHFSEKDVKAAIESIRNAMDETEEEKGETVEKEESIFETEYYYNALVSGDTEYAEVMREDIINAHIANGKDEEEAQNAFESSFRSYVGKMYQDGGASREDAEDLLINYGGRDENEAYWDLRKWDYVKENGSEDGYSMYNEFNEAVRTGKNLKAVIKEYTSHGKDKEDLARQITSYYKPLYIEMTNKERANIKGYLLNAYTLLGYDRSKKSNDIDKWLEK